MSVVLDIRKEKLVGAGDVGPSDILDPDIYSSIYDGCWQWFVSSKQLQAEFLERRVSIATRYSVASWNTHGEDLRTERMARQSAASMLATAALLLGVFANIAPSIYIFPLSLQY